MTIRPIGVFKTGHKEAVREYPESATAREIVTELEIPLPLLGTMLIDGIHAGMAAPLR